MLTRSLWHGTSVPALGLGAWPIGGHFTFEGMAGGYGDVDESQAIRAIQAAVDAGIRFFDTAQIYGAGHSEILLGRALRGRNDVRIATKVGHRMDRQRRDVTGVTLDPAEIEISLEASLHRLGRDRIDLVHLHVGDAPFEAAERIFDRLDLWVAQGRLGAWGWSTDDPARAAFLPGRPNFRCVQLGSNVFDPNLAGLDVVRDAGRIAVIRSPLARGLLGGRHSAATRFDPQDIRAQSFPWLTWFQDGRIAPAALAKLEAVQELLRVGGRSLTQGAIGWLWAKCPVSLPIPGFKSAAQVIDLAGALDRGPLPADVMDEIEAALGRGPRAPAV